MSQSEETGLSPLRQAAIQLHEMYTELKRAGFTRREALTLVGQLISRGIEDGLDN
jgi:hypothetical protein